MGYRQRYRPVREKNPKNRDYEKIVLELQLSRPRTWSAWQTEHTGYEGDHILRICAIAIALDALHWRYNHHNR
jgi:hypothetical protein